MDQAIQVLGSLLILAAFVAAQRGALSQSSRTYLMLNLVGSAVLAVLAVEPGDVPNAVKGWTVAEGAVCALLVVVAQPVWQRGPTGLA